MLVATVISSALQAPGALMNLLVAASRKRLRRDPFVWTRSAIESEGFCVSGVAGGRRVIGLLTHQGAA